jgi:hypothetical protein
MATCSFYAPDGFAAPLVPVELLSDAHPAPTPLSLCAQYPMLHERMYPSALPVDCTADGVSYNYKRVCMVCSAEVTDARTVEVTTFNAGVTYFIVPGRDHIYVNVAPQSVGGFTEHSRLASVGASADGDWTISTVHQLSLSHNPAGANNNTPCPITSSTLVLRNTDTTEKILEIDSDQAVTHTSLAMDDSRLIVVAHRVVTSNYAPRGDATVTVYNTATGDVVRTACTDNAVLAVSLSSTRLTLILRHPRHRRATVHCVDMADSSPPCTLPRDVAFRTTVDQNQPAGLTHPLSARYHDKIVDAHVSSNGARIALVQMVGGNPVGARRMSATGHARRVTPRSGAITIVHAVTGEPLCRCESSHGPIQLFCWTCRQGSEFAYTDGEAWVVVHVEKDRREVMNPAAIAATPDGHSASSTYAAAFYSQSGLQAVRLVNTRLEDNTLGLYRLVSCTVDVVNISTGTSRRIDVYDQHVRGAQFSDNGRTLVISFNESYVSCKV